MGAGIVEGSENNGATRFIAEPYGYETLGNNFVSQGLIVVLLQYRLGVLGKSLLSCTEPRCRLGFASTGDDVLPGNLGLWDQTTAFRWLYEFIGDFGGCRTNITAWGLSAGSSCVGLLALSKHSRGMVAAYEVGAKLFNAQTT